MGFLDRFFETEEGETNEVGKKTEKFADTTQEVSKTINDSEKEVQITDNIVQVAYERFNKQPTALFKVEEIAETLKEEKNEAKRNDLVRKLLIQFGNNLDDLRAEATARIDGIKRVQSEYEASYKERSEQIESQIASKQKALEDFTVATNSSIDNLKAEEQSNATKLASDNAGAAKEINRLNQILYILMETEV